MTVKLQRGQKADVNTNHLVTNIIVGTGWDLNLDTPEDHIIDMVMYGLDHEGYCRRKEDIIYFYTPVLEGDREEVIKHLNPDEIVTSNRIPLKDKEQIKIKLDDIPQRIDSLLICLGVFDSLKNKYNLNQVSNLHIQIFNEENEEVIIQNEPYPVGYFKTESCLVLGKLFRYRGFWRFEFISEGYIGDIGTLHGLYLRQGDDR